MVKSGSPTLEPRMSSQSGHYCTQEQKGPPQWVGVYVSPASRHSETQASQQNAWMLVPHQPPACTSGGIPTPLGLPTPSTSLDQPRAGALSQDKGLWFPVPPPWPPHPWSPSEQGGSPLHSHHLSDATTPLVCPSTAPMSTDTCSPHHPGAGHTCELRFSSRLGSLLLDPSAASTILSKHGYEQDASWYKTLHWRCIVPWTKTNKAQLYHFTRTLATL